MIVLVLGGARSGKSRVAERLATTAGEPVTYLATATPSGAPDARDGDGADGADGAGDADFAERIAAHRARRPATWHTVECGVDLVGALAAAAGTVLVDSIGTWVATHRGFAVDTDALCAALVARDATTIVVSEEVGLGVHPETAVGRRFRDVLGDVNQRIAAVAGRNVLVVAGQVLELGPPGAGGAAP